jgi:filamentous hemagglutinin
MQAAGAALVTGLAGGNALGGAAGAGIASIAAGKLNGLSDAIAGSDPTGNSDMNKALGNIVANVIATSAGAAVGGNAGAFEGYNVDRYNRQLHPQEKTAAKQIAANAAAQGITNPDGSPITTDQIENAMRAASNSQYGEIAATGVVVPLNANTPASAVYDTTGMKLATDSTGNYLVQDPSMLATPSKNVQDLITQNTGGASSPYSWGTSTAQAATPKIDPYGPFSPGWNTGDNSVGFQQPGIPAPDYVAVNGNALGLSGSLSMNLHNGQVYVGAGGSVPVAPSASVTLGWLPSNYGLPNAVQGENTDQLLGGGSYSVAACAYGACFGGNHAIGGATAVEVGLGIGASTKAINLGGSASTGVSLPVFKLPSSQ